MYFHIMYLSKEASGILFLLYPEKNTISHQIYLLNKRNYNKYIIIHACKLYCT